MGENRSGRVLRGSEQVLWQSREQIRDNPGDFESASPRIIPQTEVLGAEARQHSATKEGVSHTPPAPRTQQFPVHQPEQWSRISKQTHGLQPLRPLLYTTFLFLQLQMGHLSCCFP